MEGQTGPTAGGQARIPVPGIERRGSSDVWFISEGDAGTLGLLKLVIKAVAVLDPFDQGDQQPIGVERFDYTIDATDVDPAASTIGSDTAVVVPDLEAIAIMVTTDTGHFWVLVDEDGEVVRSVKIPDDLPAGANRDYHKSRILGTEVVHGNGGQVTGTDLATGKVTLHETGLDTDTTLGLTVYDSASDSVFNGGSGRDLHRLFLRRASNSVPLSAVVSDLCTTAGLDASELDVAELSDQVRGFVLAKQTSYRKALELLAATYLFDVVESDFRLQFKKRGRPVTRVIH